MKRGIYSLRLFFLCILFYTGTAVSAQVTVVSSDSVDCTHTTTTLTATLTGDVPTSVGITEDDIYSSLLSIGFTFNFYGVPYTQCVIGANGTVSFNASDAGSSDPWPITAALLGNPSKFNNICGPWCDIDIFYTGSPVGTETFSIDGVAPNRKCVITWCACSMFSCGTQTITSQIILYETTNIIEVHVTHKDICTDWNPSSPAGAGGRAIIGVQNATGTAATVAPGRDWEPVWSATDEAWRFTPNAAGTSYTVASIPYAPVPYASSSLYWFNAATGAYLGTGVTFPVSPTVSTTYKVGALGCADTSFSYFYVTVGSGIAITTGAAEGSAAPFATTAPSICGASDATFSILGLTPGLVDTVNYNKDGVPQPQLLVIASASGAVTITGLPAGTYDNITVKQGACVSNSAGPVVITDPAITISSVDVIEPSICGANDGALILHGLYAGHAFTVNYSMGGVAQPPIAAIASSTGTIALSGLHDMATYSNITASYSTCITPAVGPYTMAGPPPANGNIFSVVSPSQCGKPDGSIRMKSVIPWSSDTISYIFGSTAMPSFVTSALGDSSIYLPGLVAGSYYNFTVKIGGCVTTMNGVAILTDPPLTASFTNATHLGCHGDSVFFFNTSYSTGPLYYNWNYGDGSSDSAANPVHIYPAGTYTVYLTATDHYCVSVDSTTFTLGHPLTAVFTETPDILCQNQTAITTNTSVGATGYLWLFSNHASDTAANATYTYQRAGTYDLILIAHNNIPCYDTLHKTVYVDTISGLNISLTDSVSCSGTHITMTGLYASLGNTGISWNFGDGDSVLNKSAVQHSYGSQGTYTVAATAHYRACPDASATRTINVFQQPQINIGKDTSICKGSEAITIGDYMNNDNTGASWRWSTGETTRQITVVAPGLYWATVNINNCYASDSIEVSNDCYVNIPNAFTPNGDGVNDYFFPRQYLSRGLTEFKMNIYNRWGQLIFETTSLDGAGWDGRLNGVDQPGGVYVYIIDAAFHDGQREHHQSNITLLR